MTTKEKILEEIKDINYAYNDCSKYATIKNLLDEMEEGSGMDDLISRQAAIDAVPQRIKGLGGESWMKTYRRSGYNDCVDACLDAIRHLQSAQPERKKGKWIKRGVSLYRCSECGRFSPSRENYCPSCGSYNGEEKDND